MLNTNFCSPGQTCEEGRIELFGSLQYCCFFQQLPFLKSFDAKLGSINQIGMALKYQVGGDAA